MPVRFVAWNVMPGNHGSGAGVALYLCEYAKILPVVRQGLFLCMKGGTYASDKKSVNG